MSTTHLSLREQERPFVRDDNSRFSEPMLATYLADRLGHRTSIRPPGLASGARCPDGGEENAADVASQKSGSSADSVVGGDEPPETPNLASCRIPTPNPARS